MAPLARLGGLAVASVTASACFTYPCERDVVACEDDDEGFVIDRHCRVDGVLAAELAEGDGTLAPIAGAGWPRVHHGPQGGVHFLLGLQLRGVEPEHDAFQIEISARDCEAPCAELEPLAARTFVVARDHFEASGDALELADVVVILERSPRAEGELVVRVTDACGRVASVTREIG